MSITTYAELKTAIEDWEHRTFDSGKVDTFIDLFEARVNRTLRVPEMEKRATATPTSEYVALPTDFLELRNIQINGSTVQMLDYATPHKIDLAELSGSPPLYYSLVGNEFQISPSASGKVVEIDYYGKITALDSTNTSNFLLAAHPDYYLMGCIHEALIYSIDDRAGRVAQIVAEKEAAIMRAGKKKQYGSGPFVVSVI